KLMTQSDNQELAARLGAWKRFSDQIANDFSQAVGQMIRGQKSFGAAVAEVWNNLVVQFAQTLVKMVTQRILQHTLMQLASTIAHQSGAIRREAIDTQETIHHGQQTQLRVRQTQVEQQEETAITKAGAASREAGEAGGAAGGGTTKEPTPESNPLKLLAD